MGSILLWTALEDLGVALDAYLNDLSIDEIIDIISESEKKLRLVP